MDKSGDAYSLRDVLEILVRLSSQLCFVSCCDIISQYLHCCNTSWDQVDVIKSEDDCFMVLGNHTFNHGLCNCLQGKLIRHAWERSMGLTTSGSD